MRFLLRLSGLVAASLLLLGCLGSEIVGRRPKEPAAFPSLSTVPERPPQEDESSLLQASSTSDQGRQDAKEFNQKLRHYFGLPEAVDKQQETAQRKTAKTSSHGQ